MKISKPTLPLNAIRERKRIRTDADLAWARTEFQMDRHMIASATHEDHIIVRRTDAERLRLAWLLMFEASMSPALSQAEKDQARSAANICRDMCIRHAADRIAQPREELPSLATAAA